MKGILCDEKVEQGENEAAVQSKQNDLGCPGCRKGVGSTGHRKLKVQYCEERGLFRKGRGQGAGDSDPLSSFSVRTGRALRADFLTLK